MDDLVRAFFETYAKANSTLDVAAIGDLYAETFIFAVRNAARPVRKEDFLKVVPRMKEHFASLGLTGTRLSSVETTELGSGYALTKVRWAMTLRTGTGLVKTFDTLATYLVQRDDHDKLSVLFQLDHQDLAAIVKQERGAD
ncbi:MAG: hypothetical protein ABSG72_15810 [Candidatus Sulfotelmatobacter sp.]|jgi:hypothetical protein